MSEPSWDTFSTPRGFQPVWVTIGVLFLLPSLVATYLRVFPPTDDVPALIASFIPFALVGYTLATLSFAIALVRARRRPVLGVLTGLTAVLLACHLSWLAPLFISDHRDATSPSFTLMSLNMRLGEANRAEVTQVAQTADVVVLLEATPLAIKQLTTTSWRHRFPYSVSALHHGFSDTLIFSRFRLSNSTMLSEFKFQQWVATADVPHIGAVRIIAAHPCNPYCGSNHWYTEHLQLRATADANLSMPLVVAGDLNATDDHGPLRALRRDGVRSVTDITGAGWLPTYPANSRLPPVLPIDHILVNHYLTATSVHRFQVSGTDHLGLIAQLAAS